MNIHAMTVSDVNSQLVPGKTFQFTVGESVTNLEVVSNDGVTLTAKIIGGPKDHLMVWNLVGLDQIAGLSTS